MIANQKENKHNGEIRVIKGKQKMNYLLRDPNVRLCLKSEYNNKNFKKIYNKTKESWSE